MSKKNVISLYWIINAQNLHSKKIVFLYDIIFVLKADLLKKNELKAPEINQKKNSQHFLLPV